jgi:hypothetical protein
MNVTYILVGLAFFWLIVGLLFYAFWSTPADEGDPAAYTPDDYWACECDVCRPRRLRNEALSKLTSLMSGEDDETNNATAAYPDPDYPADPPDWYTPSDTPESEGGDGEPIWYIYTSPKSADPEPEARKTLTEKIVESAKAEKPARKRKTPKAKKPRKSRKGSKR